MTTKELLDKYDQITTFSFSDKERALWNLLKFNEEHIDGLIEEDETGYWFHKAFRQTDVCGNANMNMTIWLLLHDAPLFWKMLNDVNKLEN